MTYGMDSAKARENPEHTRDDNIATTDHTVERRRSRASFKGLCVARTSPEDEEESIGSLETDFSLSESILRDFEHGLSRDSMVVTKDRNASRRRSRASIKGLVIDASCLGEIEEAGNEMSESSLNTEFSLDNRIIRDFGNAFARNSIIVAQERSAARRRSRGSIKGMAIEVSCLGLEEIEEADEDLRKSTRSLTTDSNPN